MASLIDMLYGRPGPYDQYLTPDQKAGIANSSLLRASTSLLRAAGNGENTGVGIADAVDAFDQTRQAGIVGAIRDAQTARALQKQSAQDLAEQSTKEFLLGDKGQSLVQGMGFDPTLFAQSVAADPFAAQQLLIEEKQKQLASKRDFSNQLNLAEIAANKPKFVTDGSGNVVQIDPKTGTAKKIYDSPEKLAAADLVQILDENGNPTYVRATDALGKRSAKDPESLKAQISQENTLRDDFTKQSAPFITVRDNYARIKQITSGKPNAATDISLVFAYMKMLDPSSTVREGEYATAANAAGIPDQVRNAYNKAKDGQFLTPQQRQSFATQAGALYNSQWGSQRDLENQFKDIAKNSNARPDQVVIDYSLEGADKRRTAAFEKATAALPPDQKKVLEQARGAIKAGANPAAVKQRLLQKYKINAEGVL